MGEAMQEEVFRQLAILNEAQAKALESQRKSDVKSMVLDHKSAGAKRMVGLLNLDLSSSRFLSILKQIFKFHALSCCAQIAFIMNGLFILDDVDSVWDVMAKQAEVVDGQIVTEQNIAAVNAAIAKQAELLVKMRKHFKSELKSQVVASKSLCGWKTVHRIEEDPDFNKDIIGIDGEEVRKLEKEIMQRESKCSAPF